MTLIRAGLLVAVLCGVLVASREPPATAHAEATGTVAIACETLVHAIDGNVDDQPDEPTDGDLTESCDGLDAADIADLADALGDEDDILEASDFIDIDLDDNQIRDAGSSTSNDIYLVAFVDDDEVVTFDAEAGVNVLVNDDGGGFSADADANAETCGPADDKDCDSVIDDDGDGVVVAMITDGAAVAGDLVDVDVSQADNASAQYSQTIKVVGAPNQVALSVIGKNPIQTNGFAGAADDCAESAEYGDGIPEAVDQTMIQAVVTDSGGTQLTRVDVVIEGDGDFVVSDDERSPLSGSAEQGSAPDASSGVTIRAGGVIAEFAVICGGAAVGEGTVTALISPNGFPGGGGTDSDVVGITVVGPPDSVELQLAPAQFVCDGANTATVTATVRDSGDSLVADGVAVNFSVTSVGIVNPINAVTTDGVATTTFTGFAASSVGVPVIVTSGDVQASILVHCIGFDTDGDGMPNVFESATNCLNPNMPDSSADPDADTLTSLAEYQSSLNPCNADSDADTFGDGSDNCPGVSNPAQTNTDVAVNPPGDAAGDACDADDDNDRCIDAAETGGDPSFGGSRDPLDPWDFFDVTGDAAIDLADVLAVLGHYGHGASDDADDGQLDRYVPDGLKPWRTAAASDGIDLQDALANLLSFGHSCAP